MTIQKLRAIFPTFGVTEAKGKHSYKVQPEFKQVFDFSLQAKSMSKRARAFFGGVQTRAMLLKSQLYLVMFFAAAVSPL